MITVLAVVQVGLDNSRNMVFLNIFQRGVNRSVVNDAETVGYVLCGSRHRHNVIARLMRGAHFFSDVASSGGIADNQHAADTFAVAV